MVAQARSQGTSASFGNLYATRGKQKTGDDAAPYVVGDFWLAYSSSTRSTTY